MKLDGEITHLPVSMNADRLVGMKHDDLPERWKAKVADWVSRLGHSENGRFSAMDFPCSHSLDMTFDDGSKASFHYAILIEAPEFNELGVFTEHCGYHVFPLGGTHVARIGA